MLLVHLSVVYVLLRLVPINSVPSTSKINPIQIGFIEIAKPNASVEKTQTSTVLTTPNMPVKPVVKIEPVKQQPTPAKSVVPKTTESPKKPMSKPVSQTKPIANPRLKPTEKLIHSDTKTSQPNVVIQQQNNLAEVTTQISKVVTETVTDDKQTGIGIGTEVKVNTPFSASQNDVAGGIVAGGSSAPSAQQNTMGNSVIMANYKHKATPVYPNREQRRGISGVVELEFIINVHGKVKTNSIRVIQATNTHFAHAATQAIQASTFYQTKINGKAVEQKARTTIEFKM